MLFRQVTDRRIAMFTNGSRGKTETEDTTYQSDRIVDESMSWVRDRSRTLLDAPCRRQLGAGSLLRGSWSSGYRVATSSGCGGSGECSPRSGILSCDR